MGKRGPRPAPTHLKLLKGEKKSRINDREPKPAAAKPPAMPAWLPADAKALWKRLAPQLFERKVLTDWDREALAVLCNTWATYRKAAAEVTQHGVMRWDRDGVRRKNPALSVMNQTAITLRGFLGEFGLTPSSRSGIKVDDGTESELEQLLTK